MLEAIHFQILVEGFWILKRHLFNYALGVGKKASLWRIICTIQVRSRFIIPATLWQACHSQHLELRVGIWGWERGEMASDLARM